MTKTKKVVAMLLAFLMIFSSASVLASAWDVETDDGSTLEISTKFFKEVNGEWVETTKVAPGSNVKARVYLGTDYYSNDSDLLFFYDKDFFTTSYGEGPQVLSVNPNAAIAAEGYLMTNSDLTDYVDSAFLNEYAGIEVTLDVKTTNNVMFDDSTWLFEFDLTVLDSARGEGDLFVEETTIQNTDNSDAKISVPKGPADGTIADAYPMWLWDATPVLSSQPVSTDSSVTFSANEGAFADGATEKFGGENYIGATVTAPAAPTRAGYTFMGWIDAADATPTLEEAKATVLVTEVPEDAMTYNAFWLKNVNITFNTDGGTEIPAINDVTPYTDFADVADPTKTGYTFVGWDVRDGELPETYPDVDTEYTAIWALNVTVSFDTDGAEAIPSVDGYAGADFEAEIADPSKEGHRFVMWSPALPEVFPEQDTTYKAIFETKIYSVYYYVDGKMKSNIELEYGETIPTNVTSIKVPAGYELSGWYTDADYNNEYTGGTMGAEVLKLYAKTTPIVYNAVFVADGEIYEKIPTAYEAKLVAPATAPTKVGYEFAGWSPDAENGIFTETEDMYFYATWTPVNGNVIFVVDGTNYQVDDGIETGANIDVPADPYKEGYNFLGWADTEGATEANVTFPQTMPALAEGEKIYYYAVFEIESYNVIWDVDGETTEETYEYNAAINAPADPEKTGYTFAGWEWTRTEGGAAVAEPTNMPAYNVTATATWNVNQYTVTWVVDGVKTEETYDYGETITVPADPEKEGYLFNGWEPAVVTTMGAADVTYTATWAHATNTPYTIETYIMDTEGNYGAAASTQTKYGETDTTVSTAHVAMDGFTADTANSVLSGTVAADGSLVLKLAYSRNKYALTTDVDGEESPAGEYFYEAEIAEPVAPANKEGHTFAGWAEYTEGMKMPIGGQTLTATWTVNEYDVTFIVDGATVQSGKVAYGAAVNAPADPEKEGHTFAGWTPAVPATQGAADATYEATWTVNEYDVEFIVDGVTVQSGKVAYGATVTAPADPEKEGHTFAGWTPSVPATQGAADATYEATWTTNEYTVEFIVDGVTVQSGKVAYGAAVEAPADPEKEGYTFAGWAPSVPATQGAADATYTATWVPATDTPYTIETYIMDTEGNYGDPTVEVKNAATESEVSATHVAMEGFKPDENGNVFEGVVAADGSTTLKLYYVRNQYTFKTVVDGVESSETYYYDAAVTAPAEPEKAGYDFAGWDGTVPSKMPANDVTLTAKWTASTDTAFKVIINYKDGANGDAPATDVNEFTGTTGYAIVIVDEIPAEPAADTVYVLWSDLTADWADAKFYELSGDVADATILADGSTVINVEFTPVLYTATFNAGEGEFAGGEKTATSEVDHFDLVKDNLPAEPTREGYTFGGWIGVSDSLVLSSNKEFTAKWNKNNYTVTWDVDGATTEETYAYGATIVAPADPEKEGYTFAGWEGFTAGMTMPANNLTFTATWTVNEYNVEFIVDGTTVQSGKVAYGEAVVAPADPEKEGYTFAGWTPEVPATQGAADATYEATWTVNEYNVTFVVDGATVQSGKVAYGAAVNAPADPEKEGYTFAGWTPAVPATQGAADATYEATWTVNEYNVTFIVDGATVQSDKVAYGAAVTAPADPEKEGYTFAGWTPAVPATQGAADATYEATWTVNSYNAIFNAEDGTLIESVSTEYGKAPKAPAAPAKEGYGFAGWKAADGTVYATADLPIMGAADVTYTATYTAGAVNYTVETYIMDTEGNYGTTANSKETKSGTADTTATVAHVAMEGFTADTANSVLSGNIEADGSLVLKLAYSRNKYALTTNVDGDESTVGEYYYEAVVAEPTAPANKEGHTFAGWNGYTAGMKMPAEAVELTAKWDVNNYTVTWDVDGATTEETYAYGAAINKPADPEKEGYTFAGWSPEVPATQGAADATYTAQWTVNEYNVTFVVDGATVQSGKVAYGEAVVAPADPEKEGYTFAGWTPAVPATQGAADATYEATWTVNEYNVEFIVDGTTVQSGKVAYGEAVTAPADPTKEGHTFAGWSPEVPATQGAADATYTAQWTTNEYKVTWVVDGVKTEETYAYGATIVAPADPEKEGYTFAAWAGYNDGMTMPAQDKTFTATWTKNNYTVTWDVDGATTEETYAYGATIVAPADPTKEGHTFAGWSPAVPETQGAADATYTATWTVNEYNVTFVVDGTTVQSGKVAYGAAVNAPADPEKEGYTFAGWTPSVPATQGAADATYEATWTVNEYNVEFIVDGVTVQSGKVAYGAAVNAPADPEKEGYTFAGWTPAVPATQGAADATYEAAWTVNNYTVTWKVDGEVYDTETYAYGAEITAPVPTKDGYTFSGWSPAVPATQGAADATYEGTFIAEDDITYTIETYIMDTLGAFGTPSTEIKTGETDSTVSVDPEDKEGFTLDTEGSILEGTVAADGSLVLEVYYLRNKYALSTNVDGTVEKVDDYYYEAVVAEPAAPENKEGHTFAGWDGYTAGMKMPAEAVELTAKWTVNEYDVTFIVDGTTVQSGKVAYGDAVVAPADPEKEGYTFAGWSPAVPATQGAADATYEATWTVNEYNVTFVVDGVTVQSGKVAYGAAVNAPADPEKDGYTFAGWSPAVPATQGAADATYEATWTVNKYTVTYANTGDTTIAAVEADFGTAIAPVEDPTWEGYTFRGWKWTDADGAEISAPATIPAYNVTATAQWTANSYTIDWMVDGQLVASDAHDFGEAITAPTEPTKDGYAFAGWTWAKKADGSAVAASATMPAYDVVATAQWTAKGDTKYTVEIYKMATDGVTYEKVETIDTLTGATASTATYVIGAETGFTVNAGKTTGYDAAANTANAVINGDGSTVIAVYYDRDSYKITINDVTDDYYYGEEIEEPKKPTPPTGYEQDPENPWVDENGDPVEFPLTVGEDNPSEIKPNYRKLSYEIAWTIDGVTTTDTYEFEAAVTAPEIPAKEGYRVVGWVDADGKLATVPATMPASDLAYTALYETLVYGINYYVDGKLVATVSTEYGEAIQAIDYNAPLGYEFDGWYTDEEMTVELGENAVVTAKSTDLYGKLVAKMYDAIFMVDGEVYDTVETAFDAQIAAPADPVKEGYVFIGWTPDVTIMDEEGKTFVANFEPKAGAYTITYDVDGKTDVFELAVGDEFEIAAEPTKEGYEFAGWADAEGNIVDSFPATMPAENLVFTATWTVKTYTVTWTVDGESTEETYEFGATIVAPADPEKEGSTFAGWDPEVPATMPAEDLEFTATWTTDTYTITWIVDGIEDVDTYEFGAAVTAPADPAKEGFEFAGWVDGEGNAADIPSTMPAENLTFTASWTEVEDAIPVKLVPVEGSTTMIERNKVIESYNDGYSVITDSYDYTTDSYEEYYIYGLKANFRERDIANYFTVQGDGRMEKDTTLSNGGFGTGCVIKVYDQKGTIDDTTDDVLVEQFYIIIFGDVDGNARIQGTDVTMIKEDVVNRNWSGNRDGIPYMKKAASIDGNNRVAGTDATLLDEVVLRARTLNQITGTTTLN